MTDNAITITLDDIAYDTVKAALAHAQLSPICNLQRNTDDATTIRLGSHEKTYPYPVRLGHILDEVYALKKKIEETPKIIEIGSAQLDTHSGIFIPNDKAEITLTEKEVEILLYLYKNRQKMVSKEELLDAVWNYAKNVETHTLETHIYRLRQKIEDDPSNPVYLKTKDKGYTL